MFLNVAESMNVYTQSSGFAGQLLVSDSSRMAAWGKQPVVYKSTVRATE
jgi:ATP adenylyltransferase/5',5'''-P-1,P-4-tetraphosphate phosphorylase II